MNSPILLKVVELVPTSSPAITLSKSFATLLDVGPDVTGVGEVNAVPGSLNSSASSWYLEYDLIASTLSINLALTAFASLP